MLWPLSAPPAPPAPIHSAGIKALMRPSGVAAAGAARAAEKVEAMARI